MAVEACLPLDWLARPATTIAPDLLGRILVRQRPNGQVWRGVIVETEAYEAGDPACHGYRRQTARNAAMFGPPGTVYVYQIYGMYYCLNLATDRDRFASAVLIRALSFRTIDPADRPINPSIDHPKNQDPDKLKLETKKLDRLAAGPGKLCRAFEIDLSLCGSVLGAGQALWLEPGAADRRFPVVQTTRIGLSQGQELPWRWYIEGEPAVSKPARPEAVQRRSIATESARDSSQSTAAIAKT